MKFSLPFPTPVGSETVTRAGRDPSQYTGKRRGNLFCLFCSVRETALRHGSCSLCRVRDGQARQSGTNVVYERCRHEPSVDCLFPACWAVMPDLPAGLLLCLLRRLGCPSFKLRNVPSVVTYTSLSSSAWSSAKGKSKKKGQRLRRADDWPTH